MDVINPIPALLPGLRDAALRGMLIPFVGAGASRLAGCPNWTEFADRALRYFVDQGKFSHGQLAQLNQQPPRVKLSIALGLQHEHKLAINFDAISIRRGATPTRRAAGSMKPYPTSEKPSSARASPHVIEAVLNHRSGVIRGVAAVYNRCRYEPEKREALSAWAAHVANLIPAPAIGLPLAA